MKTGKLSRAPLIHALIEVKFATILSMRDSVPRIQDSFRRMDFPIFKEDTQIAIEIESSSEKTTSETNKQVLWRFTNKQNTRSFHLRTDGFSVQTTEYDVFKEFVNCLRSGLQIIDEHVDAIVVERVGVRFTDVILPEKGKTLTEYVEPFLLGFGFDKDGNEIIESNTRTLLQTQNGVLRVTSEVHKDRAMAPADLLPIHLTPRIPFPKDQLICVLDTDHFIQKVFDFEINEVIEIANKLHDGLGEAFKGSVTDAAWEEWK